MEQSLLFSEDLTPPSVRFFKYVLVFFFGEFLRIICVFVRLYLYILLKDL